MQFQVFDSNDKSSMLRNISAEVVMAGPENDVYLMITGNVFLFS